MNQLALNLPWVDSPFFEQQLPEKGLDSATESLVQHFAQHGYVIFDPELDSHVVDTVREGLKSEFLEARTNRLQDTWQRHRAVQQIAAAPRVMELLRLFYQREPIPFQTLHFSTGSQQRTHSDSIHFNSVPERFMCGVWVALEDVHEGNGPLHYYPGSHRLPTYDLSVLGLKGSSSGSMEDMLVNYYAQYENFISELTTRLGLEKKVLNLKKGQAMIWSANLLHGGEPIAQPGSTRYTQVTHYYFADCAYYRPMRTDMALERISIQKVTNIATGKEVKSQYLGTPIKHVGYSYKVYLPNHLLRSVVPAGVRQWVRRLVIR